MPSKIGLTAENGYQVKELFDKLDYGVVTPNETLVLHVNPSGVVMLGCVVMAG